MILLWLIAIGDVTGQIQEEFIQQLSQTLAPEQARVANHFVASVEAEPLPLFWQSALPQMPHATAC
jgi:hypothetical protein